MKCITPMMLCLLMALTTTANSSAQQRTPAQPTPPTGPACRPTPAQMVAMANKKWTATHDANAVLRELHEAIGYDLYETLPMKSDEGTSLAVHFPSRLTRFMIQEAMRTREPISAIRLPNTVGVNVSSDQINSPDIVKVVVERDGKVVRPLSGALRPVAKVTALGARAVVHEGSLTFACSAFAPGAQVVVTAIPESGSNLVITFDDEELATMTGIPAKP